MASPEEDALVARITGIVGSLLEDVVGRDADGAAAHLLPNSLAGIGLELFGLDALAVPIGLAAEPQGLGMSALVQAGEGLLVAEVRGLDARDQEVSVCSIAFVQDGDDWLVDDIWPVPATGEMDLDTVVGPTAQFYTGELQLRLIGSAALDDVESLLVPALQSDALGLHLIERGVQLWRAMKAGGAPPATPASWAAGIHCALLAFDGREPDPVELAARYGVPAASVAQRFMEVAGILGFAPDAESGGSMAPPAPGLVDLSGRPLSSKQPGKDGHPTGGIILPGG